MNPFQLAMTGKVNNAAYEELLWRNVFPDTDVNGFGARINENNALTVADVFKCVRVRAESQAILPRKVYERVELFGRLGRRPAPLHPLYPLIHDRPNPMMTSFRYFEMGSAHIDTWGNWYSYIERGRNTGRVRGLWPLCPHRVRMETIAGQLWYWVSDEQGKEGKFYPDEILHVPGLGYDGLKGYSPVRLQMNAMSWQKSTENFSVRFFSNGARPGGLLIAETGLSPEIKKGLKESFEEYHRGTDNAHRIAVIEGGLKFQPLSMPNDEAQFLDTIKFQRSNIAGLYRVPAHMIGDPDPISDNNVEHISIQFVTAAIQPNAERFDQEFERALMTDAERQNFFIESELKALMKGDTAARTTHYREMINMGVYCQNDVCEEENIPPFKGGDTHWMQLNMAPIEQLLKMATQANTQPNPPAALKASILEELQARFRTSYRPSFRDAVGRTINRKAEERQRTAPGVFRHLLVGLSDGLSATTDDAFLADYLGELGKRAASWHMEAADTITGDELDRAVTTLVERGSHEVTV